MERISLYERHRQLIAVLYTVMVPVTPWWAEALRVPQPDMIKHFGNADAVPQPSERCLSRKAGIVRRCPKQKNALQKYIAMRFLVCPAWATTRW